MTTQQRNERIAEKMCGLKVMGTPSHRWYQDSKNFEVDLPDFINDSSTGMMLVEGLGEYCEIHFVGFENDWECWLHREDDDMGTLIHSGGTANTPHAALIAAIEEWIEEGE